MCIYAVLVSFSFFVGHAITNDIDPVVLVFMRFALGGVLFGVFVAKRFGIGRPSAGDILRYTVISMSLVGYFIAMFYSLRYTTPFNASVLYVSVPLFTTFYGVLMLGQKPGAGKLAVLVVTMLGSVWVISGGEFSKLASFSLNRGDMIFLLGCMSMGFYPVLSKLLSRGEKTPVLTFWTLATGAAVLLFAAGHKAAVMDWAAVPLRVYLGLGYITIFTTIMTFFILQYASLKIPVSQVTAYIYIIPVFVMIEKVALGQGMPALSVLPGVAAVAFGLVYFMKGS